MFAKIWALSHLDLCCTENEEYCRTLGLYKDEYYHGGAQFSFKFIVLTVEEL